MVNITKKAINKLNKKRLKIINIKDEKING